MDGPEFAPGGAAQRADGSVVLAGASVLRDPWQPNAGWQTPAMVALREDHGLVRHFGAGEGTPRLRLVRSTLDSRRGVLRLGLRAGQRGIARVTVRWEGRRIGARIVSLPRLEPARYRVRIPLDERAGRDLRRAGRPRLDVRVRVSDTAGNLRTIRRVGVPRQSRNAEDGGLSG